VRVPPGLAIVLIAAGAVAVLALWWHDTPSVYGLGDWLTNAGRITGLLAGYAVVVLLALMARAPAVERGLGADRLTRWHAMGGRYTVGLSVTHTLLIVWGYALTSHTNVVSETRTLIVSYPDVLMATVAVVLLVGVGITSARAARRRLRYETWHLLHLYTYLAIALAFSHQFATGADFIGNAAARTLWAAFYVVVGVLLLWYRVAVPVRSMLRHRLRVAEVRHEDADVVSIYLTGENLPELRAEPGQFFRWRFLTRDLWWAANPYSLSAAPRPGWLRITVKVAGDHSAGLRALQPGTRVFAEGPYGSLHRRSTHPPQGPAPRRRRRDHAASGTVRVASRRPRRHHADLPHDPSGRHRLAARARLDRQRSRRARLLPDRRTKAGTSRPVVPAEPAEAGARPAPQRRVRVRPGRDGRCCARVTPGGARPPPTHPLRILHVLRYR